MLAGIMHLLRVNVNKNLGKENFLFLLELRHLYLLALEHQKSKLLGVHIFITEILRHTSCDAFGSTQSHTTGFSDLPHQCIPWDSSTSVISETASVNYLCVF